MVLVGPPGAGKSTLGPIIASRVRRPFVDLDAIGDRYYSEVGWSIAKLRDHITAVGRLTAETDWEPARAHAVTRVVADHPGAVIAMGVGHTSYTRDDNLTIVRTALRRCPDVIRILPSPDMHTSLSILRERCITGKGRSWLIDGHDFLAAWLNDPGPHLVATRTIYTTTDTPGHTADRLLRTT